MSSKKTNTAPKNKYAWAVILYVAVALLSFVVILAIPASREVFKSLSATHPYIMGFVKFAILATAGELIAARLAKGAWSFPKYVAARFIIWGLIGIWITYMMKIFTAGVIGLMADGFLPDSNVEWLSTLLRAFFISVTMNTTFGPTFMALHKCSDTYLDLKAAGNKKISVAEIINTVDWNRFVSFTLLKTVPIFWIPAHTITFLLPSEYQVMMAAFLSVALGIILNIKKKK